MHAAAQIKTEIHRLHAEAAQPARRARRHVQRNRVILAEIGFQLIDRRQLFRRAGETRQQLPVFDRDRQRFDFGSRQRLLHRFHHLHGDLRGAFLRYLHRRVFAIDIRQGNQQAEQRNQYDQRILPEGIMIHVRSLRVFSACLSAGQRRPHVSAA